MTELLYRADPYQAVADCLITGHTAEGAVIVDRSVFYPTGGGQPGDSGMLEWSGGRLEIATAIRVEGKVALIPAEPQRMIPIGTGVRQVLNWPRRLRHMRMHTALHLLSVVVPCPVTGGQIGAERSRLDFDMPEPVEDPDALILALNALIARDLPVSEMWISDDELEASPDLVKTMNVRPPAGQGRVRLVQIGSDDQTVDLQPCGGTHVARTGEIGRAEILKIENKGRHNRRITIGLID
jgi:misacylated tRNA(Ala) deacylase